MTRRTHRRHRRDDVPETARWFVRAYLAAFLACGLFAIEAWPLTGWQLFSGVRSPVQRSWHARAVTPEGTEIAVPFERFSTAYRGFTHVLQRFPAQDADGRAAICAAWLREMRRLDIDATAIRIYRTERSVAERVGDRGAPATRSLRYTCDASGVTEITS